MARRTSRPLLRLDLGSCVVLDVIFPALGRHMGVAPFFLSCQPAGATVVSYVRPRRYWVCGDRCVNW